MNKRSYNKYVLHLASWYPNKFYPQEVNFVRNQIKALSEIAPAIVCCIIETDKINLKKEVYESDGNVITQLVYVPIIRSGIARRIKYFISWWFLITKTIKKNGLPVGIHVHASFRASLPAFLTSIKYTIPYIITEHDNVFTEESDHPKKNNIIRFSKLFMNKARTIIVVSDYLKQSLLSLKIKVPINVVYNFVETSLFKPKIKKPSSVRKFLHISHLGNKHKNPKGILEAFKEVENRGYEFELTLVGSFPTNNIIIKQYLSSKQFTNKVEVLGPIEYEKLPSFYQESDALIMFSNYETFSCVIAEAQCCGIPSISTNVGGPKELISDSYLGILVPKGDVDALVNATIKLINDFDFNPNYIKRIAIKRYGKEHYIAKMKKIYKSYFPLYNASRLGINESS